MDAYLHELNPIRLDLPTKLRKTATSTGVPMFFFKWIRRLVSIETGALRRWGVEKNVWFINRVDN